ncbi:hypothetical protein [Pseudonocardia sp. TRM90224]|uniref:hypothetical protein n=1 Tax=Pseudonocardia sp. TRM90224 TaxID=2812678 RepID=UPI001E49E180|nr:hypothetical protein [Pseudonocardia sp. TRM90224]
MDIIVVDDVSVRTVVLTLRHRTLPLTFTLFPMMHVGEPAFYDAVAEQLRTHDLIVAEGVGSSVPTDLLTLTYRFAGDNPRLGLVVQPGRMIDVGVPLVRPDMTGPEFEKRWRTIRRWERAMVWALAPVVGLHMRLFASRKYLASMAELDDDVIMLRDEPDLELRRVIGDERDALLTQALAEIVDTRGHEPIKVAVVYGAEHVHPVVTFLSARYRYVPRAAEWLTIFHI